MPRKQKTEVSQPVAREAFLRSINLVYDADEPERIAHFRPTAKTVPLLKALIGEEEERAYFVLAPYGSGKSLTATYALQVIENRPGVAGPLGQIADRLEAVSPEMARYVRRRGRNRKQRGVVVALHGYRPNVAEALRDAAVLSMKRLKLGRQAKPLEGLNTEGPGALEDVLAALQKKAGECECDQVVLLWDEFGRHLEALAQRGADFRFGGDPGNWRSSSAAPGGCRRRLSLFLHQSLLQYAGNMTQSVRSEWTKIEGRFRTLQYVDESKEIYRLISEVVASRRSEEKLAGIHAHRAARECKTHGLFGEATLIEIQKVLHQAFPLEPVTLIPAAPPGRAGGSERAHSFQLPLHRRNGRGRSDRRPCTTTSPR